ncbi:hypothetical protein LDENG_00219700 [Lucifuga dentata]|nr:hypothetical protein LDENG_00219700 [Lucifuga dentata]
MGAQEQEEDEAPSARKRPNKTSKEVYFSVLPDKYEPLIEEAEEEEREETLHERRRRKEEKRRKKKEKHKKYRKNIRKAFGFAWRCLVVGLQSMASGYATPFSAAAAAAAAAAGNAGVP